MSTFNGIIMLRNNNVIRTPTRNIKNMFQTCGEEFNVETLFLNLFFAESKNKTRRT